MLKVNNKCDGNENWCGLKRKLLDVVSEVCGYTKGKPRFGNRVGMRKIGRNIVRQKEMLRD